MKVTAAVERERVCVIEAIFRLDANGIYTDILFDVPRLRADPDVRSGPREIWDYKRFRDEAKVAGQGYEEELKNWIQKYRLTIDGEPDGKRLEWMVAFARSQRTEPYNYLKACADDIDEPKTPTKSLPMRQGLEFLIAPSSVEALHLGSLPDPRHSESFPAWLRRVRPTLKGFYRWARLQSRRSTDGRRGKPKVLPYEWFVLRHFTPKPWTYSDIADHYDSVAEDRIRKAVQVVKKALLM